MSFFITNADAKKILPTADDATLKTHLETLDVLMTSLLGTSPQKHTITEHLDGSGTPRLFLSNKPTNIPKLTVDARPQKVDFVDGFVVVCADNIPKGIKNVTATYEAGFDTCPADLAHYARTLLETLANSEDASVNGGIASQKIGDLSVTFRTPADIISTGKLSTPEYQKILQKYQSFALFSV